MPSRKLIPLAVAAGGLLLAGVAAAYPSTYRDGPLRATFHAPTHRPNCKQMWPVTVTATYNGRRAHATAYYQFLLASNQQLVSTQQVFGGTRRNPHNRLWHFYGSFYDNTFGPFGARAVGHPLIVRAVVRDGRYTAYPGYTVTVVNARGCRP